MGGVLPATLAELVELQASGGGLFIFRGRVIALFAILTLQANDFSHDAFPLTSILFSRAYAKISAMVPAPTVRPPSRMANLKPFSMATGVISSMVRATLSPGITISAPAGNSATPVTSVVLK